jgi:DNA replication protein
MSRDRNGLFGASLLAAGSLAIPLDLLKEYAALGMSDHELVLVLHILAFRQFEHKEFPTFRELAERMSCPEKEIVNMVSNLIMKGFLALHPKIDTNDGMLHDSYDLAPLFQALAQHLWEKGPGAAGHAPETSPALAQLFQTFEEEFGRPLSVMELEQIVLWIDQDGHHPEVIREALREAVLGGVYSVKYIDRILLDWQKKRITTAEQAKSYREKFRNRRAGSAADTIKTREEDKNRTGKYEAFYKLYRKKGSDR